MALNQRQARDLDQRLGAGITSEVEAGVSGSLSVGVSTGASGSAKQGVGSSASGVVDDASLKALSSSISQALRARASLELGIGGVTPSGVSATGGTNVGASLGVGGALSAGIGAQASVTLKSRLSASLGAGISAQVDAALATSGLPQAERLILSAQLKTALADELNKSVGKALGADPGFPNAGGAPLLTAEVTMLSTGAWHAQLGIDSEQEPTGPYVFRIGAVEFRGTIVPGRSGHFGGRTKLRIVGGAGGLSKTLKARNYSGGTHTVRQILDDILRETGESLSSQSDAAVLGTRLAAWHRTEFTAKECLDALIGHAGASWRILRDGTLWVGVDTWPEVTPDGELIDEDWSDGVITVSSDDPTGVPGVTISGQQVEQVVHRLDERGIRTDFYARSPKSVLTRFLAPLRTELDYAAKWRCRVVTQNADRTLQLMPDEPRMRGQGLDKVKIRVGLPGMKINAQAGATCNLGFENRDPSKPYATDWEEDSPLVSWELTDAKGAIGGVGSVVEVRFLQTPAMVPGSLPFTAYGIVTVGNPKGRV